MAATTNLYIDQGADFTANIDILQDNGEPFDLQGGNVIAQMRRSFYSTVAYPFATTILDEANGNILLSMSGDVSSGLKPGRFMYDILVKQYNANTRVLEGIVTVYPQVSV